MIPVIAAKKGSDVASKALTGDIYVRRWTSVPKKGKRKGVPVEHEVRVNAVTAAVAAVGVGLAALAGGAALWMTQQKLGKSSGFKTIIRRVRVYEATYKTVTVVDTPAHDEWVTTYIHGVPKQVLVHYEAVTHQETIPDRAMRTVVMTDRGVPIRQYEGYDMSVQAVLGPRLGADYTATSTLRDYTGADHIGTFHEWDVKYTSASKHPLQLNERKGLLE